MMNLTESFECSFAGCFSSVFIVTRLNQPSPLSFVSVLPYSDFVFLHNKENMVNNIVCKKAVHIITDKIF